MRAWRWRGIALAALVTALCATCGGDGTTGHVCVPGRWIACVGPGGCAGGQECYSDGTAYAPCFCTAQEDASIPASDASDDAPALPGDDGGIDACVDAPAADAPENEGGSCIPCGTQGCCNGICTDTNTDTNNCGYCGNACLPGPAPDCVFGQCGCSANSAHPCSSGDTCCSNGCKNLLTDRSNCGECGKKCTGNQTCTNGGCSCGSSVCVGVQICCSNGCVDKNTDSNNCGFCGNQCQGGNSCVNGLCQGTNNCGPGGTPCPYGQQCCPNICCTTCLGGVCMDGQDAGT